eukprot:776142-Rhodomonas_salina.7
MGRETRTRGDKRDRDRETAVETATGVATESEGKPTYQRAIVGLVVGPCSAVSHEVPLSDRPCKILIQHALAEAQPTVRLQFFDDRALRTEG